MSKKKNTTAQHKRRGNTELARIAGGASASLARPRYSSSLRTAPNGAGIACSASRTRTTSACACRVQPMQLKCPAPRGGQP